MEKQVLVKKKKQTKKWTKKWPSCPDEYPLVIWVKKHGMSTADMSVSDFQKYMRWWMHYKPVK